MCILFVFNKIISCNISICSILQNKLANEESYYGNINPSWMNDSKIRIMWKTAK